MSKITIAIEAQALIPILEVFKEYFDTKYPGTDETNDGSDMPVEDDMKWETYNYLLNAYNKSKGIYNDAYMGCIKKLREFENQIEKVQEIKQ